MNRRCESGLIGAFASFQYVKVGLHSVSPGAAADLTLLADPSAAKRQVGPNGGFALTGLGGTSFRATSPKIFSGGDMVRGSDLAVATMFEGREVDPGRPGYSAVNQADQAAGGRCGKGSGREEPLQSLPGLWGVDGRRGALHRFWGKA